MIFDNKTFFMNSPEKQKELVNYFLSRKKPFFISEHLFMCKDWRLGDDINALENAERTDKEKFLNDDGRIIPFKWRNPEEWGNFSGYMKFYMVRGNIQGDICLAYLKSGNKKYLKLFAEYLEAFEENTSFHRKAFDMKSGSAAFYGGFDPNMSWAKTDWGPWNEPMDLGHRISRHWRIWASGIFKELPANLSFNFLKRQYELIMEYNEFADFPYKSGNHYLFELGTVPYLGASMFPEFEECRVMRDKAVALINNYVRHSILPDGSYMEHSSSYTVVTFLDILAPYCFAERNDLKLLTKNNSEKLKKFAGFIFDLFHPCDTITCFGDSTPFDINTALGITEKELSDLGIKIPPRKISSVYPHAGYAFLGNKKARMSISAMKKHFPKAHIHWEHLTFEFCYNGILWIADPASVIRGREAYTRPLIYSGKAKKAPAHQYHYSLAAHNCVLIDDLIPGDEAYTEHEFGGTPAECSAHFFSAQEQKYSASHYLYISLGIRHKRIFQRLSENVFLIEDIFSGHPDRLPHLYRTLIHPMPDIKVELKNEKCAVLKRDNESVSIYFHDGRTELNPDIHIRKYAYNDDEKNLSYISSAFTASGPCRSSFAIVCGKHSPKKLLNSIGFTF